MYTVFYRRNCRQIQMIALRAEMLYVKNTLLTIMYYRHMQRMRTADGDWTDRQRLAQKCMRHALTQYATHGSTEAPQRYATLSKCLRDAFIEYCETFMADNYATDDDDDEERGAELREECSQCDAAVEPIGASTCTAGHAVTRCCTSAMLLSIVSTSGCSVCKAGALESARDLEHVMRTNSIAWMCPICDVALLLEEWFLPVQPELHSMSKDILRVFKFDGYACCKDCFILGAQSHSV